MNPELWLYISMAMGVLGLAVAAFYASQVLSADPGNEEMVRLMSVIRKGAMAFLRREYLAIVVFVALLAVLLVIFLPWGWPWGAVAYVFGASLSALAGFIGGIGHPLPVRRHDGIAFVEARLNQDLRHAFTFGVHAAEIVLRPCVPLFSRLAVPLHRFGIVLGNAFTFVVL